MSAPLWALGLVFLWALVTDSLIFALILLLRRHYVADLHERIKNLHHQIEAHQKRQAHEQAERQRLHAAVVSLVTELEFFFLPVPVEAQAVIEPRREPIDEGPLTKRINKRGGA